MIQLTILNDQAAAAAPELERVRRELTKRLLAFNEENRNPAEETRLTRALAVISALSGQTSQHLAALAAAEKKQTRQPQREGGAVTQGG
jgi:hypothetical protein